MASSEMLLVYTVESAFNDHPMSLPLKRSCPRVVGIEDNEGDIVWADPAKGYMGSGEYDKSEAIEIELDGSSVFNRRVLDFFATFMAHGSQPHRAYNCHGFAAWVARGEKGERHAINTAPDNSIAAGNTTMELTLGEQGVIGVTFENAPEAYHSVIGLGNGNCIQATSYRGQIGITGIDAVIDHYSPIADDPRNKNFGMYTYAP